MKQQIYFNGQKEKNLLSINRQLRHAHVTKQHGKLANLRVLKLSILESINNNN